MLETASFFLGLVIGSFLNVIINRLPQGESVVYPPSGCPKCGSPLCWYELIPVVSFCLLRGKCRHCGGHISSQYPLVELLTGFIYLFLYTRYQLTTPLIVSIPFASLLITITMIDLKHQLIPDALNIAGAVIGICSLAVSNISPWNGFIGAFLGGGIMLVIAVVSRGGMGGGDIKMIAWMGLLLGWKMTLLALFLSFIIGGLVSLLLIMFKIRNRKDFIPFGPFLAAGGFVAFIYGPEILTWYLKTL